MKKQIQMLVGPTEIPHRVLKAMNCKSISHRSKEYSVIQERVTTNLKKIFGTEQEVLILTSSGTGAMEAVIVNCFSPNDEVVVPIMGKFSEQYALMA
ncbi:MAG: aminotransferase class V-fold PLP-dependent enzyme, partial [Desulfitobacteriaceae bacterium]